MGTFEVGLMHFCIMIWLQAFSGQEVESNSLKRECWLAGAKELAVIKRQKSGGCGACL